MNEAELDDDYALKTVDLLETDELKTPTNGSSNSLVKFVLESNDDISTSTTTTTSTIEDQDDQDVTLDENTINSDITENNHDEFINDNKQNLINSYSHSMPQLPIHHPHMNYISPYMNHGNTMCNLNTYFNQTNNFLNYFDPSAPMLNYQNVSDKENQLRNNLLNNLKFNQFHFHNLDTFGFFIRYILNLKSDVVKEMLSNHKIQYWIDRNKVDGFVYQSLPKMDESKNRLPPVRCELCKFYGHLSHNCSIKELSFKLYNVALKSGACRCHICGQLGHPAEAGLCPYIACSFCRQFGHWNHMCPNIDKVSRTLCYKCQRYGHRTEICPDQWRQFDRISTYEQTPYKDPAETNKPVYCYQCAKKGHYGHNCPDFYRKYFIRDNHQLNPVYFFAGSSPFIKFPAEINENDKKLIKHLVDNPLDDTFKSEELDQDPLEQLEKHQAKLRNENKQTQPLQNQPLNTTSMIFNEASNQTQLHASDMPIKKYIRKWSNWVIDFNWIFTLKFLVENLPTNKLYFLIKNYPILDNFILHWMWWSYTLNKDLEEFTKDSFRGIGSMPWLVNDINNNNNNKKNLNKKKSKKIKRKEKKRSSSSSSFSSLIKTEDDNQKSSSQNDKSPTKQINEPIKSSQSSKFFNYDDKNIRKNSILFQSDQVKSFYKKKWISCSDFIYETESRRHQSEPIKLNFDETCQILKSHHNELSQKVNNQFEFDFKTSKSKSMIVNGLSFDYKVKEIVNCNTEELEDDNDDEDEDLENTIVYLDKEKINQAKLIMPISETKLEEKIEEKSEENENQEEIKVDVENQITNQEQQTSVFDKFIKSINHNDSSSTQAHSEEEIKTMKKENNENFNKLIDFLKKSNKIKSLEQGLIVTVSDLTNDSQVPKLDSAPTVEQIETEILAPVKTSQNDLIEKQKQTDSTDLIKILLKIDKNSTKPSNSTIPSGLNILDKLQEKAKNDHVEQANIKLNLLDILKNSVNHQNDAGSNFLNKILTTSNCTPINIDIVNQQIISSSSSSSGSCLSLSSMSSLSSISPQPSILSSNSSPNSLSSSNSSTAKPNIDSSFSTSISSSKSADQVSTSSVSLSSSSSSVSIESTSNKQYLEKTKGDLNNNTEETLSKKVENLDLNLSDSNAQSLTTISTNKIIKNSKFSKNGNKTKSLNFIQRSNNHANFNRHLTASNYQNYQNRSLNNSKLSYSNFNFKQHNHQSQQHHSQPFSINNNNNSNNMRNNFNNFHNRQIVHLQQHSSVSASNPSLIGQNSNSSSSNNNNSNGNSYYKRSLSNTNLIQSNKFPKSNSLNQASNYQNKQYQNGNNNNNNMNYFYSSSLPKSSSILNTSVPLTTSVSQPQASITNQTVQKVENHFNWSSNNNSYNLANSSNHQNSLPNFTSISSNNNTNYNNKNNNFMINKQLNRNQSSSFQPNQYKQQTVNQNGQQINSNQNRQEKKFQNHQNYMPPLLQFQQIYTNNNTSSSTASSPSTSLSTSSTINSSRSNSSTPNNNLIQNIAKQNSNLNTTNSNILHQSNNYANFNKKQNNSIVITNNTTTNNNNYNLNNSSTTINNSLKQNSLNLNLNYSKKNFRKQNP